MKEEYQKLAAIVQGINPRAKLPASSINDDLEEGRQILKRHGLQIRNLLEGVTGIPICN